MKKHHACPAATALSALALALATALPATASAQAVELSWDLQTTLLPDTLGGFVLVDLMASYDGADKLLSGAASFTYDAAVVEVAEVTLMAPSDVGSSTGTVGVVGHLGTVSGIGFASFVGVGGSFQLATIKFKPLVLDSTTTLTAFDSNDLIFPWVNESLAPITVTAQPGFITSVPEPAAQALMLAGLLGIGCWTSRRRVQASGAARRA